MASPDDDALSARAAAPALADPMLQTKTIGHFITQIDAHARATGGRYVSKLELSARCGKAANFGGWLFIDRMKHKHPPAIIDAIAEAYALTPEYVAHLNHLNGSHYRQAFGHNYRLLPDLTIDDARLMAAPTLHEFVDLRLQQIGLERQVFGKAMGHSGVWGSNFVNGKEAVTFLEPVVSERMAQVLFLNAAQRVRFNELNETRKDRVVQRRGTPDERITDEHLRKAKGLGELFELGRKRMGIAEAFDKAMGITLPDGRPHKQWLGKQIARDHVTSRLERSLVLHICAALHFSDRATLHALRLNAARPAPKIKTAIAHIHITEDDILAAETVDELLLLKLQQQGLKFDDLAVALDVDDRAVEALFKHGRVFQMDAEKLSGPVRDVLAFNDAEMAHLLALNAALPRHSGGRPKTPAEDIPRFQLLACASLGQFLELKLAQLGMAQRALADAVGVLQTQVSHIVVGEFKGKLPSEVRDQYAEALHLTGAERNIWNWLNDVRDKQYKPLDAFKEQENALLNFLGYALINRGQPANMDTIKSLIPLRQQSLMNAYFDIGFSDDVMQTIARKLELQPHDVTLFSAINEAISHRGQARIREQKGDIKPLFEAQDLCEAISIACERNKTTTISSLAQSLGTFPDILQARTSYRRDATGKTLKRGLVPQHFQSIMTRLEINDPEELQFMKILNGCLWERYRNEPFIWPEEGTGRTGGDSSGTAGATASPTNRVAPDERARTPLKSRTNEKE